MDPIALSEIAWVIGADAMHNGAAAPLVTRVVIDSREVAGDGKRRDLFWGLRGSRCDGGTFAADAIARGAVAAVVNRGISVSDNGSGTDVPPATDATAGADTGETPVPRGLPGLVGLLRVPDTLAALQRLARWYRERMSATLVAVTGSVGKTTTREMIHAALAAALPGTRSRNNHNNQIGVPLSLLDVEARHVYAVLELGANHVGEIRELAGLCRPQIGVLTAVAPAHLEGFGSLGAVADAKAELFESLPGDGLAVLAGDDPIVAGLRGRVPGRAILVGEHLAATDPGGERRPGGWLGQSAAMPRRAERVLAERVVAENDRLEFSVAGQRFRIPVAGRHHLTAALCAIATAREFGIADRMTAAALADFVPPAGRCRVLRRGDWVLIDDTYNASPRAMEAAINVLASWRPASRRILVAGDMRELGGDARPYHEQVGRRAAEAGIDCLAACGEQAATVVEAAVAAGMPRASVTAAEAAPEIVGWLRGRLVPGAVLLAKGSRAVGLERVIEALAGPRSQARAWQRQRELGSECFT